MAPSEDQTTYPGPLAGLHTANQRAEVGEEQEDGVGSVLSVLLPRRIAPPLAQTVQRLRAEVDLLARASGR